MVYCKWCGMESRNDRKCEWCARDLSPPAQSDPQAQAAPLPVVDYVADFEEENRRQRIVFYVACSLLTVLACGLVAWRHTLYPTVSQSSLLIAGILLGALRILPRSRTNGRSSSSRPS